MGQLRAFVRKSLTVKRRSPCQLCCEIVPPIILLALAIVIARILTPYDFKVVSNSFPQAGPIPSLCAFSMIVNAQPIYLYSADALVQPQLQALTNTLNQMSGCNTSVSFQVSAASAETNFELKQDGWTAGIDVTKLDVPNKKFEYTIRMPYGNTELKTWQQVPKTAKDDNGYDTYKISYESMTNPNSQFLLCEVSPDDLNKPPKPCDYFPYSNSGFVTVQLTLDYAFRTLAGVAISPGFAYWLENLQITYFPHQSVQIPVDFSIIAQYLGFSYISCTFVLSKQMLSEKEKRIKEAMKIMSMKTVTFWAGWFITALITVLPVSFLVILAGIGIIFRHSSPGLVILVVLVFALSLICLTFLVYTLFEKARNGGVFVLMVQIIGIISYTIIQQQNVSEGILIFISLLSPLAFLRAATLMAAGVKSASQSKYSIGGAVAMMVLDSALYLLFAWYIDKVKPGEFGQKLPWYFPFLPSYWMQGRRRRRAPDEFALGTPGASAISPDRIQQLPPGADVSVQVTHLRKLFQMNPLRPSDKDKLAVEDLSFGMVRGQIFSLLGHNGAGKTTTISMITGIYPITSGDITIDGLSVNGSIDEIRKSMGLCPQHDVLYDELTVEEHLQLYGEVKGVTGEALAKEVTELIEAVDLSQKRFNFCSQLSGGMKRKLSLAIAYIGNSKLVVLDEPTAGMDPLSRRKMWDLINRMKPGRTTLLTTHFLDEADILGDRIGIMANGRMKCLGTSQFLKNRFGLGYTLGIVKEPSQANADAVRGFVRQFVPTGEEQTCTPGEQSFRLPTASTSAFPALLSGLRQVPGVISYGLSITTLEEVFLKVADEADEFSHQIKPGMVGHSEPKPVDSPQWQAQLRSPSDVEAGHAHSLPGADVAYKPTFGAHFHALALKRWWQTKRALLTFIINIGVPFAVLFLGGGLATLFSVNTQQDPLVLDVPTIFGGSTASNIMYSSFASAAPTSNSTVLPNAISTATAAFRNTSWQSITGDALFYNLSNTIFNTSAASDDGILNYPGAFSVGPASLVVWENRRITHSLPVLMNLLGGLAAGPSDTTKIVTTTQPLAYKNTIASSSVFTFVIFFVFAYCFPPGYIGVPIVSERVNKTKHSMRLMGLKMQTYWFTTFLFDFVYMTIPTLITIIVIAIFKVSPLYKQALGPVVLVLFLYQFAAIAFAYFLARLMTAAENFQLASITIGVLLGMLGIIAYLVLDLIATLNNSSSLRTASEVIFYILNFIPIFNVAASFYRIGTPPTTGVDWTDPTPSMLFKNNTKLTHCIGYQVANIFIYGGIVLVLESNTFRRLVGDRGVAGPPPVEPTDSDVMEEKRRMLQPGTNDAISMRGLRKVYAARGHVPEKVAVNSTYLGIPVGEVFGLLGGNGAGKTTTMSILTGDILPSGGEATVDNNNIQTDIDKAYRVMGYCPQFDALFNDLTGREHLRLFSMIKGVPNEAAGLLADDMLSRMSLVPYADKLAGTYSGGNKRKLSVTVALMANPKVVYLDEPSTGMDPASRRFMWDVISSAMSSRAVVLTTHSMEEADALCSRIGIMVNGELKCVGSAQHLKNKFGSGLQIQLSTDIGNEEVAIGFVQSMFPQSNVSENFAGNVAIEAEAPGVDLGPVFQHFETYKQQYKIHDYSIAQTTLEQVFLRFARGQVQERD